MNDEIRNQVIDEELTPKPTLSIKAIVSFLAGLGTYVWFFIEIGSKPILTLIVAPVIALIAIITGHGSKRDIRKSGDIMKGKKFANAGLALGYIYLLLGVVVLAILSIVAGGILSAISGLFGA